MKKTIIATSLLIVLGLSVYWLNFTNKKEKYFSENKQSLKISHSFIVEDGWGGCDIENPDFFAYEWIDDKKLKVTKTTGIETGSDSLKEVRSNLDNQGNLNIFIIQNYCSAKDCQEILSEECSEFIIENISKEDYTLKISYLNPKMTGLAKNHPKEEIFSISSD